MDNINNIFEFYPSSSFDRDCLNGTQVPLYDGYISRIYTPQVRWLVNVATNVSGPDALERGARSRGSPSYF